MKIAIRADASLVIGAGHIMRCLTLAEALRMNGNQCYFICREYTGHLAELIESMGFQAHLLSSEGDWVDDLEETKSFIKDLALDWMIVDHYGLDIKWENGIRSNTKKIMIIDDIADRKHDCDLLLDQNHGREKSDYFGLIQSECIYLMGSSYALLRREFLENREYSLGRRASSRIDRVIISIGSFDHLNITKFVLDALRSFSNDWKFMVTVVLGSKAPWLNQIKLISKNFGYPIEVEVNPKNIARLLSDSDIAIGGFGSSSWERCCLGVPSISTVVAENQRGISNALFKSGASYIFDVDNGVAEFNKQIANFFEDSDCLFRMSENARKIVDGKGVYRVMDEMKKVQI